MRIRSVVAGDEGVPTKLKLSGAEVGARSLLKGDRPALEGAITGSDRMIDTRAFRSTEETDHSLVATHQRKSQCEKQNSF